MVVLVLANVVLFVPTDTFVPEFVEARTVVVSTIVVVLSAEVSLMKETVSVVDVDTCVSVAGSGRPNKWVSIVVSVVVSL